MLKKRLNLVVFIISLVAVAVLSRAVSHAWNFTILGGLAIFSGLFFTRKSLAVVVIFASLLISDAMIGFHNQMPAVYFSFLVMIGLGSVLSMKSSRLAVFAAAVGGSFLFFLITNFFVWFEGSLYPQTWDGLVNCYVMGVPFYRNQFVADVISTFALVEAARAAKGFIAAHFDQYQVLPGQSL